MSFSTMPRMTASQIEDYMKLLPDGSKYDAYCVRFDGKWALAFCFSFGENKSEMAMCSQREKTRTFATLESARKACDFVGAMTVIGK